MSGYPVSIRSLSITLQSLPGDMSAPGTPSTIRSIFAPGSACSRWSETRLPTQPVCFPARAAARPFDPIYPTMVVRSNGGQTLLPVVPGQWIVRSACQSQEQPATGLWRANSRLTTPTCTPRPPLALKSNTRHARILLIMSAQKLTAKVVDKRPITAGPLLPSRSGASTT